MTPILRASACPQCGSDSGGCAVGERCLPSDYIDPDDCPPGGCADGEECLPSDYIDPADCPACDSCCGDPVVEHVGGAAGINSRDITSDSWTSVTGSIIVAIIHTFDVTDPYTDGDVTDSQGNAYTFVGGLNGGASAPGIGVWVNDRGTRGAATTVRYESPTSGSFPNLSVIEITGQGSAPVNYLAFATAADAVSPLAVTAAAEYLGSQIVLYGATVDTGDANAWTNPTGYTTIFAAADGGVGNVSLGAYKVGETGTPTVSATKGGSIAAAREVLVAIIADCPECPQSDASSACPGTYVPYCLGPENADDPADVQAAILATTPFSYYTFDGTPTGGDDQTGNGHAFLFADGTLAPDTAITAKNIASEKFTAGGRIQAPNPAGGDMTSPALPWASVQVLQIDAYNSGISGSGPFAWLSYTAAAGSPFKFYATVDGSGHAGIITDTNFGDGQKYAFTRAPFVIALGDPHVVIVNHLTAAATSGVMGVLELWVDGVLWLTCPASGVGTAGDSFTIGRSRDNFFGALDMHASNWILYDRSLNNSEIQLLTELLADDPILANGLVIAA